MRVQLTGKDLVVTDQLKAYVEYRLFTSIARYHALIRDVNVTLEHNRGGRFLCLVAIDLGPGERINIRAYGTHPNAAIDRAGNRASLRLSRRSAQHVSS